MNLVHDAFHFVDFKKGFSPIERQNAIWVLFAKPVQGFFIVADRFWQTILNFRILEILVKILDCLAETVPALKIALGCQYYVEERGFSLPE